MHSTPQKAFSKQQIEKNNLQLKPTQEKNEKDKNVFITILNSVKIKIGTNQVHKQALLP